MNIHRLTVPPEPRLARGLAEFESRFTYPLGTGRKFRIDHGDDYSRFFRAMGDAACFVAERDGQVLGTIGAAIRRLHTPQDTCQTVLYLGDLKILPQARGGRTLLRLIDSVRQWIGAMAPPGGETVQAAIGVIMDGTAATPERYTGRLNLPEFRPVGKLTILRVETDAASQRPRDLTNKDTAARREIGATQQIVQESFAGDVPQGRFVLHGGDASLRSEMLPVHLPDDSAGAFLEDTRKAKRLFEDNGREMLSAHLSGLRYRKPADAAPLILAGAAAAAKHGFPAMFVALPEPETEAVLRSLNEQSDPQRSGRSAPGLRYLAASATVWGTRPGLPEAGSRPLWMINTSEI